MKRLALIVFVVALACKPSKPVNTIDVTTVENQAILLNDIWVLEEINGVSVNEKDFMKGSPTLEFHMVDGKVMGNSGCNQLSGTYFVDGDKISFGPMISTKMACPGNGEQRFLSALNSAKTFKIENLKLYLLNEQGEVLQFRKVD